MRVVSLLPAATEIAYALGVEPVAVSHECDYPPEAADRPAVTESRIDPDASSSGVNQQVADAESEAGDGVFALDRETLRRTDPDVVLTQGICDVCAVDHSVVRDAVADLGLDADVIATHPHTLDDLFDDVGRIGAALDATDRAVALVAALRARIDAVEAAADAARTGDRPRVAVLDWMDPVMVAGHWVPELVELAGGRYGLADAGDRSRPREWADVRDYDPEVVVASPCGFTLDRTLANADELADRDGWRDVAGVRDGRAYAVDGHHYLNRPGPRLVESLELVAACIHESIGDPPEDAVARLPSG